MYILKRAAARARPYTLLPKPLPPPYSLLLTPYRLFTVYRLPFSSSLVPIQPLRHRTFQHRYPGIGNTAQTVNPSVRNFTVTFPAWPVLPVHGEIRVYRGHPVICQYLFVTTDTVLFHNPLTGLKDHDDLRFGSHGKDRGVPHAVLCFKIIFVQLVIVRDVAIVAMCHVMMRAVAPGGILRRHDMTVNACFRFI